jgi:hypothetical protein
MTDRTLPVMMNLEWTTISVSESITTEVAAAGTGDNSKTRNGKAISSDFLGGRFIVSDSSLKKTDIPRYTRPASGEEAKKRKAISALLRGPTAFLREPIAAGGQGTLLKGGAIAFNHDPNALSRTNNNRDQNRVECLLHQHRI